MTLKIWRILTVLILSLPVSSAFAAVDGRAEPWQMHFMKPASPVMERIVHFHDVLLVIITVIAIFVTALLLYVIWRFRESKNPTPSTTTHHTWLEVIWTAIPAVILVGIGFPSVHLLTFMDKTKKPELTLKVTGHQWYWEYDLPEHDINFNSYTLTKDQMTPDKIRLLDVDQEVILPVDTNIKVLVTATDVLHSFAVPAFGIKQDAVPGRLRETWVRITRPGIYYGQCSELCGQGHGFMSIAIRAVSKDEFQTWLAGHKKPQAPAATPAPAASAAANLKAVPAKPSSKPSIPAGQKASSETTKGAHS